jgi:predicted transcriptional regulator
MTMNKLKEIRTAKGISQWKLAKDTNVPQSKISLFENGLIDLSKSEIERISDFFNMVPEELFGLEMVMTRLTAC